MRTQKCSLSCGSQLHSESQTLRLPPRRPCCRHCGGRTWCCPIGSRHLGGRDEFGHMCFQTNSFLFSNSGPSAEGLSCRAQVSWEGTPVPHRTLPRMSRGRAPNSGRSGGVPPSRNWPVSCQSYHPRASTPPPLIPLLGPDLPPQFSLFRHKFAISQSTYPIFLTKNTAEKTTKFVKSPENRTAR